MKGKLVYFTYEEYQKLVEASRTILKGRRGSHTKQWRIRKKLVQETITTVLDDVIKDLNDQNRL